VAAIVVDALRATTPAGESAKAKYHVDETLVARCRQRCADLLSRHVLYPEIEL
jgi:hypothetical protein